MFVDASALIAIIADEPEASALAARLDQAGKVLLSPVAIFEATAGLARIANVAPSQARQLVRQFIEEVGAQIVAIDAAICEAAIEASQRFGNGRHPARLNMGDCFAYACAKALDSPLLFKGGDFSLTDVIVG